MAEVALILGAGATLIGSVIYSLKNIKTIQSCCCSCQQNVADEQKTENDTVVNFIKSIKEKFSPRKPTPVAVWGSDNPQLSSDLPKSLPLPRRAFSVG
jgi:hypothetical protein